LRRLTTPAVLAAPFLAALVVLAACSSGPSSSSRTHGARGPAIQGGAACVVGLSYDGAAFDRLKDSGNGRGCGIATAVSLIAAPADLSRPVRVDCTLARRMTQWNVAAVQPVAETIFGQTVAKVHHYGGYVCRGRSTNSARLSEHAYGRAIDIAAFELEDGTLIRVKEHWRDGTNKSRFLREVAARACDHFSVVLTPATDGDHANHFHLDVGPWSLCSI